MFKRLFFNVTFLLKRNYFTFIPEKKLFSKKKNRDANLSLLFDVFEEGCPFHVKFFLRFMNGTFRV